MKKITVILLVLALVFPAVSHAEWFKGNTHTHTVNSDGDSSPDIVVRWYKEHGYNFVCITDHNYLTPVEGLNSVYAAPGQFLVISGEEVTDAYETSDRYWAIHLNSLNHEHLINPARHGASAFDVLQADVDSIRKAGAVGHVNHPNFHWSISADDLYRMKGMRIFEIYNGHPTVNNHGGGGMPGTEAMWDSVLTRGRLIYGVATDDAHSFRQFGPNHANPGRGWIQVRADELEAGAITRAIERGDFYASTGVTLEDIKISDRAYTVEFEPARASTRYTVYFIGRGGRVLQESTASPAVYRIRGDELYVRARVEDSNGNRAWTQPFFTKKKQSAR